jgi:hypothetical protein
MNHFYIPPCTSLKYVKFQRVTALSIFVENNQGGDDVTRIQKIAIFGQTGDLDKFNVAGKTLSMLNVSALMSLQS